MAPEIKLASKDIPVPYEVTEIFQDNPKRQVYRYIPVIVPGNLKDVLDFITKKMVFSTHP